MDKFVIARKVGMTQFFSEEGAVSGVTVVKVEPATVIRVVPSTPSQVTSTVVIGYGECSDKRLTKPESGIFSAVSVSPKRHLVSFKVQDPSKFTVQQVLDLSVLADVARVTVRGVSIGKGFAGTIKRHNFSRGPRSHGSKNYRAPGSIGAGTTPGRVLRGKRMAGHMGDATVSIRNLDVVKVDFEKGLLYLKGAVPGKKESVLEIFGL